MSSTKDYLNFILDGLSLLSDVAYRPMMGGYILYYQGKIFGGIYDGGRFLIKDVSAARRLMPNAPRELPYEGSKREMLLVEPVDDREFLRELVQAMVPELPPAKKKQKR